MWLIWWIDMIERDNDYDRYDGHIEFYVNYM